MVNPARLVTADDLERMPEDDFRYELVRGRLVRMSPVGPRHGRIAMALAARLWNHVTGHSLGEIWTEVGFRLAAGPDTVRAPDVSFVSTEHLPRPDARGFYRGAPELAIEVLSRDESRRTCARRCATILPRAPAWLSFWIQTIAGRPFISRTPPHSRSPSTTCSISTWLSLRSVSR